MRRVAQNATLRQRPFPAGGSIPKRHDAWW
jgi:hypothetical protein